MRLKQDDILAKKYTVVEILATGQFVSTYRVVSRNQEFIAKSFSFHHTPDWKSMELFEREAKTLQNLEHPRIPRLIEFVKETRESGLELHLIMQAIPGQNLAQKLENGWRPSEEQLKEIARQSLEILTYLHGLNPPVIHRDIKPSNLILNTDNQLYLIDFGGVQQVFQAQGGGGSTIIGTYGYMAPEQFQGRSGPGSDLYSLGATLIHLASGLPPGNMEHVGLKTKFQNHVQLSSLLTVWLEKMLEPDPSLRFQFASEAQAGLVQPALAQPVPSEMLPTPTNDLYPILSPAELQTMAQRFSIPHITTEVSPRGFRMVFNPKFKRDQFAPLIGSTFGVMLLSTLLMLGNLDLGNLENFTNLMAIWFGMPNIMGVFLLGHTFRQNQTRTEIRIGPEEWQLLEMKKSGEQKLIHGGTTQDLQRIDLTNGHQSFLPSISYGNRLTFYHHGRPYYLPCKLSQQHQGQILGLCKAALSTYKKQR